MFEKKGTGKWAPAAISYLAVGIILGVLMSIETWSTFGNSSPEWVLGGVTLGVIVASYTAASWKLINWTKDNMITNGTHVVSLQN